MGAGGFGRETAEAVRAINRQEGTWNLLGFVDDRPELAATVDGLPVLGPIAAVRDFPDALLVICNGHVGDRFARLRTAESVDARRDRCVSIIHPAAVVPPSCVVGPGCVLLAGVVATTAVRLGRHVLVEAGVVLTHDDVIDDYATLAPGVRVSGSVHIGEGAYIGTGAAVHPDRSIGAWSVVGLGAAVLDDVPACEQWVGVPARRTRHLEPPGAATPP